MTPAFKVAIEGNVIDFGGRVSSITITNESPDRYTTETSDSCEIVLEDTRTPALALPRRGVEIHVWLGYEGHPLVDRGTFIVDTVKIAGPPSSLIIRAQSNPKSPHDDKYNSLSTVKSRSFPAPLTIQQLVQQIGKDNHLNGVAASSLASVQLAQVDQTNEGDIDVLLRVARIYDAAVKIEGGNIAFITRGAGVTATGQPTTNIPATIAKPGVPLDATKTYLTKWDIDFSDFISFQTAVAAWHNQATGQDVDEMVGSGAEPTLRLTNLFPNQAQARAAAQSALQACDRRVAEVEVEFPGNPNALAEGTLTLEGVREGADDTWYIRRVVHRIDQGGYTTEVNAGRLSVDAVEEDNSDTE